MRDLIRRHDTLLYFALAYLGLWIVTVPAALRSHGADVPAPSAGILVVTAPASLAIILTAVTRGRSGVRALLAPLGRWRVGPAWWLLALVGPPVLYFTATRVAALLGVAQVEPFAGRLRHYAAPFGVETNGVMAVVALLAAAFTIAPVMEELGWRGYALSRMQARWSPVFATLVLGALWSFWHLPSFLEVGSSQYGIPFWSFVVSVMAMAIVLTWIVNATGSLLLCVALHGSVILATSFFPVLPQSAAGDTTAFVVMSLLSAACAAVIAVATRVAERARGLPPSVEALTLAGSGGVVRSTVSSALSPDSAAKSVTE